jgi:hypothetical protein
MGTSGNSNVRHEACGCMADGWSAVDPFAVERCAGTVTAPLIRSHLRLFVNCKVC